MHPLAPPLPSVFRPNRRHQRNQNGEKTLKPVSFGLSGQNPKIFEAKKLNQRPAKCAIAPCSMHYALCAREGLLMPHAEAHLSLSLFAAACSLEDIGVVLGGAFGEGSGVARAGVANGGVVALLVDDEGDREGGDGSAANCDTDGTSSAHTGVANGRGAASSGRGGRSTGGKLASRGSG